MMEKHLVLLGDSIFDNAAYVPEGPSVIDHLHATLASGVHASLVARDGDKVEHIVEQVALVPEGATHLAMSVGGNDALDAIDLLSRPTDSVRNALGYLNTIRTQFRQAYRAALWQALALGRPLVVCTIYDAVPNLSSELQTALCLFNDSIVREAYAARVPVIDIRCLCTEAADYSEISPIEPSEQGGRKIATALANWLTTN